MHAANVSAESKRVVAKAASEGSKAVEASTFTQDHTYLSISRGHAPFTFVYKSIDKDTGNVVWRWPATEIRMADERVRSIEEPETHQVDQQA